MSFKPFKPPTLLRSLPHSQPEPQSQPKSQYPTTNDDPPRPVKKRRITDDNSETSTPGRLDSSSSNPSSDGSGSGYRKPLLSLSNNNNYAHTYASATRPTCLSDQHKNESDNPPAFQQNSYYTVLHRKPTSKKNKTWDGDGILVVKGGYAYLQDASTGKDMGRVACSGALAGPLLPESLVAVAGREVEVQAVMGRGEFLAGRAFLGAAGAGTSGTSMATVQDVEKSVSVKVDFMKQKTKRPAQVQKAKPVLLGGREVYGKKGKRVQERDDGDEAEISTKKQASMSHATTGKFKNPLLDHSALPKTPGDKPTPRHDPKAQGALVLKRPATVPMGKRVVDVVVDPVLSKSLRKHQREGVEFLYECVMGMRHYDGDGAILADEMGLGKTLQVITLLWTLLKQSPVCEDGPVIKKALIVCPVTVINNWRKEFRKWLGNEKVGVFVFDNSKRKITDFTHGKSYNIMIVGYERLLTVQKDLQKGAGIDIVIADEGHRLKSAKNKCASAIKSLSTTRKIVLSGTPLQNDLTEFYFVVDLVNPGILGKPGTFKSQFEKPIVRAGQPDASAKDIEKGEGRSEALADLTSLFILRRTSEVLTDYLPQKTEYILFCRPTATQASVYRSILDNPVFSAVLRSPETSFQLINILKKLCNSPSLLKGIRSSNATDSEDGTSPTISRLLSSIPSSSLTTPAASAKLRVLDSLLHHLRTGSPSEKIVIVSHYTTTLDLIATLLSSLGYTHTRLDGSTPQAKRQSIVDTFNRVPASTSFAFLMSAKAGGIGINLIGASRLVLFDVDWNPATETQALARIHRDGQKRHCKIYRLLVAGALDERIFQRQTTKTGLADSIMDGKSNGSGKSGNAFSVEELRDLFSFREGAACLTHDLLGCNCDGKAVVSSSKIAADLTVEDGEEDAESDDEADGTEISEDNDDDDDDDIKPWRRAPVKASVVDMDEQERQIRESADTARSKAKDKGSAKDMRALMRWSHIDTSHVLAAETPELGVEDDEWHDIDDITATLDAERSDTPERISRRIEERVDDEVLMSVLRDGGRDGYGESGSVGYVFVRTTGARL